MKNMKICIKNQEYYKIVLDVLSKLGYDITLMPESFPYAVFADDDMVIRHSQKEYFTRSNISEYELLTIVFDNRITYEFVKLKRKQWKYAIADNNKFSSYLVVVDAQDDTFVGYAMNLQSQKTLTGLKQNMEALNYDIQSLQFDDCGALIIK